MTKRQLQDFLRRLGKTPDEVAATLRRRGVKGSKACGGACPVANAIARRADNLGVYVSRYSVRLADSYTVKAPRPVINFICKFDNGHYPDLVA